MTASVDITQWIASRLTFARAIRRACWEVTTTGLPSLEDLARSAGPAAVGPCRWKGVEIGLRPQARKARLFVFSRCYNEVPRLSWIGAAVAKNSSSTQNHSHTKVFDVVSSDSYHRPVIVLE